MKRIHWVILFAVFFLVGFFKQELIELFEKPSTLERAIETVSDKPVAAFTIYDVDVQEGKNVNGGIYVQGNVNVPFNITWEAVKPTALAALKQLTEEKTEISMV